jgi:hypothetical protein
LLRSFAWGTNRRSVCRSRGRSSERRRSLRKPRPQGHVRVWLLQLTRGGEWWRSFCSLAGGGECGCSHYGNVARGGDEGRRFCSIARGCERGCRFGSLAGGGECGFPPFIASTSHLGCAPRPAQVSPDGPRYFGGTFFPFNALRPPLAPPTTAPILANCVSISARRLRSVSSTRFRRSMSASTVIPDIYLWHSDPR